MSLYDSEVASPSTSSTTTKKSPTSIASDTVLATRLKVCKLASNTKACSQLVEELELRLRIARNCQRVAEFHLERLKTTENHENHVNYENHKNHENSQLVAAQKLVDDAQRATNVWGAQVPPVARSAALVQSHNLPIRQCSSSHGQITNSRMRQSMFSFRGKLFDSFFKQ